MLQQEYDNQRYCSVCNHEMPCGNRHLPIKSNTLDKQDMVKNPSHYDFFPGVEAILIIARSMSESQFKGYCLGNALKYRLRAGKKWNAEEDLKKADAYADLYDRFRVYCVEG